MTFLPLTSKCPCRTKLPRLFLGAGKPHSLYHAIKPALQKLEQVISGNTLHPFGFFKIAAELPLEYSVNATDFLLFPQLQTILRVFYTSLTMLSGRIAPSRNTAFVRITALSFQEELDALSSAKLAN